VVLGIGAKYEKKRYPRFKEVAELLRRKGFDIVLLGDRRDYELSKDWRGVINLCGKTSLLESLYVLKYARVYAGNDSGTTHMARAVGTPVVVVYGPTHPCLGFAPFPDEGTVISKALQCSPCTLHGEGKCLRNYECLQIPAGEIVRVLEQV
jgi:ADP-heptose:LPS heptosyltransferase